LIVTIVLAVLAAAIITAIGYLNVDKLIDWRAARKARQVTDDIERHEISDQRTPPGREDGE